MDESVLRIAIFGPESTGKTRLAGELAAAFGEPWASEYVREFWDRHGGRIVGADLPEIARGQIENEERAARSARRVMFCDTELLTNVLWADLLFPGQCPDWVRQAAETRCRRYAVYLLCLTDLEFEPDPQRCFVDPEGRDSCMRLWRQTLLDRNLPCVEIGGSGADRLQRARAAVAALLPPSS